MRTTLLCLFLLFTGLAAAGPDDRTAAPRPKHHAAGWFGVSIQDVTPRFAKEEGLKIKEGAYVNDVVDESPADSAGIQEGDVITDLNGKKIESAWDVTDAVRSTAPGTKVTVKVNRKGESKSITAVIGKQRRTRSFSFGESSEPSEPSAPAAPRIMMRMFGGENSEGMELLPLGKQLAEYFEVPGGKGVLVQRVEKGSAAAAAGIKAGDVVTRVGGDRVKDAGDIHEALSDADEGDSLSVEVVRKGKPLTVTLISSDDKERSGSLGHWPGDFDLRMGEQMERLEQQLKELPRKQRHLYRLEEKGAGTSEL